MTESGIKSDEKTRQIANVKKSKVQKSRDLAANCTGKSLSEALIFCRT